MKKILFINPFGIGDILFTTPVLAAIKENCPDCVVSYWCNDRVQDIFKSDPCIDKIFALSRGDIKKRIKISFLKGISEALRLLFALKREKFDISLDFSLDHRYSFISKLCGIKKRIGFEFKNRGTFLTDKINVHSYEGKHIVEYYLELLKPLGFKNLNPKLSIFISEKDKQKAKEFFSGLGIASGDLVVGIVPGAGASWGKDAFIKRWPGEKFGQLAERLANELNIKVVILGEAGESDVSGLIINRLSDRIIDLTGKTRLEELPAILSRLNLLITNDGGPLHIASAVGVKTVSIFGPADDLVYGPYPRDGNIVVKKELPCQPCYKNFRLNECKSNRACLNSITVDELFDAVRKLIPIS